MVLIPLLLALTQAQEPAAKLARPTPQQVSWANDAVGMFIHFAPNTWTDKEYDDLSEPPDKIDPEKLDTDQWAKVAKSMGAKYIVFVAKHVGGFCWWQTDTTDYSVKSIPWRNGHGDVMSDLAKSCRRYGLKLGVYISPADRKHGIGVGGKADDPAKQAEYTKLFRQQLAELLTRYGPIFEIWFDGSLTFDVGDIIDRYDPNAIVFQGPQANIRWVGNEDGLAPYPSWNGAKYDPKTWGTLTAKDGTPDGDRWLPNECDCRMRDTWFWNSQNSASVKTVDQLMSMYEASVGHGANMLLNNTPDPSGLIPEGDAERAAEFGAEVSRRYGKPLAWIMGQGSGVVVEPAAPVVVNAVVTMEDIRLGERVREYAIEGMVDGQWKELAHGTAIGHEKIDRFDPVKVSKVRLRVLKSVGDAMIKRLALYNTGT